MKKRTGLCCLLALCALFLAGCATNPAGLQLPASAPSSETAGEDALTSEDVKTFTFEGTEYTFPLSYDVLTEQGWTVSETSDEIFFIPSDPDEPVEANVLFMENEQYPNVEMNIYSKSFLGSVDELVNDFETNRIWSISIGPEDDEIEVANYPELSIQGITFGSSSEDIINTFGAEYSSLESEGELYMYPAWLPTENSSSLHFQVKDDAVYSIYIHYK